MLRRQSVLQTVFLQVGSALATRALGRPAWAREAPPNADPCVPEEIAGATFRINDPASFSEGGKVADRPVNASPPLFF